MRGCAYARAGVGRAWAGAFPYCDSGAANGLRERPPAPNLARRRPTCANTAAERPPAPQPGTPPANLCKYGRKTASSTPAWHAAGQLVRIRPHKQSTPRRDFPQRAGRPQISRSLEGHAGQKRRITDRWHPALTGCGGLRTSGPCRSDGPRGAKRPGSRHPRTKAGQSRPPGCLQACSYLHGLRSHRPSEKLHRRERD